MLPAALSLLLVGSTVALHLEEVGELPLEDATALADALGRSVQARTGTGFVLDDPLWPACAEADRCVSAIRDRTRAGELIFLKLYAAPTRVRVIAERVSSTRPNVRAEASVQRPFDPSAPVFAELALRLFPEGRVAQGATAEDPLLAPKPAPPPEKAIWPGAVVLGASVVVAGTAVVFGVSSRGAREDIETRALTDMEYDVRLSRMKAHGWAANILFGVALAGAVTGGWLLLAD